MINLRSHGYFCRGKAISIKSYECVSVACNARAPYYIVICGLSVSTIFFPHYLVKGAILGRTFCS